MRMLGKVLIAEYRRLLHKGEIGEANKGLLAVTLMPAQISQDEDIVSSLTAVSVLHLALDEILRACESGSIDGETAGLFLEAIENMYAGDDPHGFKAAIKRDGPAQIEAVLINGVAEGLRKAKEDGASDELIAARYEDARRAVRAALEPMREATVEMDARVIELWDAPEAAEKIESINVSGHRYEEVLTDRVKSFASARRAADEIDALRERAVKALESKAAAEP